MEDGSVIICIISIRSSFCTFSTSKIKACEQHPVLEWVGYLLLLCLQQLSDSSCIKIDLCILMSCQSIVMFANTSASLPLSELVTQLECGHSLSYVLSCCQLADMCDVAVVVGNAVMFKISLHWLPEFLISLMIFKKVTNFSVSVGLL